MQKLQAENPRLAIGGVTHRWLLETMRSIEIVTHNKFAGRLSVPVLVISAANDTVVSNRAQMDFCSRLKNGGQVTLPGSLHEILIERDAILKMFWDAFDDYMS
jgi:lysophospholipase